MTDRMTAAEFRSKNTTRQKREEVLHISILEFLRIVMPEAVIHHSRNEMPIQIQKLVAGAGEGGRSQVHRHCSDEGNEDGHGQGLV